MLLDNKEYVDTFMKKNDKLISKMGYKAYKTTSETATQAFKKIMELALNDAYGKLSNKNVNDKQIEKYLHGTLKIANKKIINEYKSSTLVCPGCIENGQVETLIETSDGLCCKNCLKLSNEVLTEKEKYFHQSFATHSQKGLRCPQCKKFIPKKNDEIFKEIKCPYLECGFQGEIEKIRYIPHPAVKLHKYNLFSNNEDINCGLCFDLDEIALKEKIQKKYDIILETINEQLKTLHYKCFQSTFIIKESMYNAFYNLTEKMPNEMIPYLSSSERSNNSYGLQVKIFQEFIKQLETRIPFTYTKNGKRIEITSLLDKNLSIFAGRAFFNGKINDCGEISNNTEEIYIGGRSGYYHQPYYIGKLLNVIDAENNTSLLDKVKEYDCQKIYMKDNSLKGRIVRVNHLMIPPHYSMGGMMHICRIKKSIYESVSKKIESNFK